MVPAPLRLGNDRIQHIDQPPTLVTMGNVKGDMLPTLINASVGPVPIYNKKLSWTLGVADRTAPSHKYNHAVRIWEVDAVGRQKIVIPSGIGLAAVLADGHLSWSVKLCLSLYGKL